MLNWEYGKTNTLKRYIKTRIESNMLKQKYVKSLIY